MCRNIDMSIKWSLSLFPRGKVMLRPIRRKTLRFVSPSKQIIPTSSFHSSMQFVEILQGFSYFCSWDVNETRVRIYSFRLKSCFIMYERSKRNTVRRAVRRSIFNAVSEGHKIHYKLLLASTVKTVQQIMLCILNREKFLRCAIVFIHSTKERDRKRGHFSL